MRALKAEPAAVSDATFQLTATTAVAWIIRRIVRDYRLNWILQSPPTGTASPLNSDLEVRRFCEDDRLQLDRSEDGEFRKALSYERSGATGYVLTDHGEPACVTHFVDAARYDHWQTWPLAANQLALINIVTRQASRGHGLATALIAHSTLLAVEKPFADALCFVWWNHYASLSAFCRAGWRKVGFSIEIDGYLGLRFVRHFVIGAPPRTNAIATR